MARYLIDRYSGKEYGPAKQTNKTNRYFETYKFHVIITSWTKYFFSGRGERPNGKHLHCKTCFSFSSKGWTNSFLTWPLHVLLSSLRRQPAFRDSTSGCPAKRRLFSPAIFHIAEFICACFFFHGGFIGFTTERLRWIRFRNHYKTVCV